MRCARRGVETRGVRAVRWRTLRIAAIFLAMASRDDDDGAPTRRDGRAPTRRAALRLLGLGALAGLAPVASLTTLLEAAHAEAQDGASRAALAARFDDGHVAVERARLHGAPAARIVGLVDAEFRHTLGALLAFDAYPSMFAPWLQRVRVLSRAHGHARLYAEVELLHGTPTTWVELDVVVHGSADGTHRVELTRLRGELAAFCARWQLIATPGRVRTIASLELAVALPRSLAVLSARSANTDAARLAFAATRRAAAARESQHREPSR